MDLRKDLGLDNGDDEKSEWGLVTLGGAWRKENNILMKELISRKLELAELNEQHVKVCGTKLNTIFVQFFSCKLANVGKLSFCQLVCFIG